MERSVVALFVAAVLSACGGEDGGTTQEAQPPLQIPAGIYGATFNSLGESGEIAIGDGEAIYVSKPYVGHSLISATSTTVNLNFALMDRPIDDLNNEFPSARDASISRALSLSSSSKLWTGSGVVLSKSDSTSALAVATMPKSWRLRNLFRFAGQFMDYTAQIDIATDGTLTGYDTNGCQFTGQISDLPTTMYRIRISASNCGNTSQFIENYTYEGYGWISSSTNALQIAATNTSARKGLALYMHAFDTSLGRPSCTPQPDGSCR